MEEKLEGLNPAEVEERIQRGQTNKDVGVKTSSIGHICYRNIFTLFNAINVILASFVLFTGSYQNMLFMLVIVCNTAIGIFQEIRSKRTTDRLSIIAAAKATVIRSGQRKEIPIEDIVADDLIVIGRGDQIPSDSIVVSGTCDANESLLTGESKLVRKQKGSSLMSGSFVSAGTVVARVVHVGAENYAARISAEAKRHKKINSEIMDSLAGIIRFVSIFIFPVGLALFFRELLAGGSTLNETILSTVAAMVGMVPEGLILLTSTVLAVAVVRLAKVDVLVQQLYCIEILARVDTLCLDKTGTITTGEMDVMDTEALEGASKEAVDAAFASLAASDNDPNETAQALIRYYRGKEIDVRTPVRVIPFSSDRKWSGASFSDGTSFVMGAGQFILGDDYSSVASALGQGAESARILLLAQVEGFDEDERIEGKVHALGFVAISDRVRSTAADTIRYFKEQGVALKVISGDDPQTVSDIAKTVGIPHAESLVDATALKTDEQIVDAVGRYSVFGRVKPEQKKALVAALQAKGHVVAMTGDGVNDTLALKQADCSVAMAAGSDAARNVAHLVLVDNDFASMPKVVAEGRRSINNLQRSASLFLVKTLFSVFLAFMFVFLPWQYPFQPIQMTLISAFTIGIPSFVLALEPNKDRIKGAFLVNVIVRSIPGALTAVLAVLALNAGGYSFLGFDHAQVSTLCVLATAWVGANLIMRLSIPFTPIRMALLAVVVGGTVFAAVFFSELFGMQPFTFEMGMTFAVVALSATVVFNVLYRILDVWYASHRERPVQSRS